MINGGWETSVDYTVGDKVRFTSPDATRWNRFRNWLYGRPIPNKTECLEVVSVGERDLDLIKVYEEES